MDNIEIYIDDQKLDIPEGDQLNISLSYSIQTAMDLDGGTNPTTKSVKIPLTGVNRRIFGMVDDPAHQAIIDNRGKHYGRIYANGKLILSGLVNMKNTETFGQRSWVNFTIIGSSNEWIKKFASRKLKGNRDLLEIFGTHVYDKATIDVAETNNLQYSYPLVNFGDFGYEIKANIIEKYGEAGKAHFVSKNYLISEDGFELIPNEAYIPCTLTGFSSVMYNGAAWIYVKHSTWEGQQIEVYKYQGERFDYSGDDEGRIILGIIPAVVSNRRLAVNIYGLVQSMLHAVGYDSLYLSNNGLEILTHLFWLTNSFRYDQDLIDAEEFKVVLPADDEQSHYVEEEWFYECDFSTVRVDTGGNITEDGYYKAPYDQLTDVIITVKCASGMAGYLYPRWGVYDKNDVLIREQFVDTSVGADALLETIAISHDDEPKVFTYIIPDVFIPKGTECKIRARLTQPAILTVYSIGSELEYIIKPRIPAGATIDITQFLPDITWLDFLKAIKSIFGIHILTDFDRKQVYMEKRDQFYYQDDASKYGNGTLFTDWSKLLDESRAVSVEEIGQEVGKIIRYQYKQDENDFNLVQFEKYQGKRFGSQEVENTNVFAQDEPTVFENSLFAPTLMNTCPQIGLNYTRIPKIQSERIGGKLPVWLSEFENRLLYYAGVVNTSTGDTWTFGKEARTDYPYFLFYDEADVFKSLMFCDSARAVPGLYQLYLYNHALTLTEGKRITGYFQLSTDMIERLAMFHQTSLETLPGLNTFIWANIHGTGDNYTIESVEDYNPSRPGPVKVKLLQDVSRKWWYPETSARTHTLTVTNYGKDINDDFHDGTVENTILKTGHTWADCRGSASGTSNDVRGLVYALAYIDGGFVQYWKAARHFIYFDLSALPEDAVIESATILVFRANQFSSRIAIVEGTQADLLTDADFSEIGSVLFSENTISGPYTTTTPFTLNAAGIATLIAGEVVRFAAINYNEDFLNIAPPFKDLNTQPEISSNPNTNLYANKLIIKYTLP